MHSSRMRTGRSLTVCCSLLPGGGVVCLVQGVCLVWGGGVPGPGGVGVVCLVLGGLVCLVLGGGVSGPGGGVPGPGGRWCAWSGGVCLVWGVCLVQGVCLVWGVSAPAGDGRVSQHALRQTPLPPVDRQTLVKIIPWPNFVAAGKNWLVGRGVSDQTTDDRGFDVGNNKCVF